MRSTDVWRAPYFKNQEINIIHLFVSIVFFLIILTEFSTPSSDSSLKYIIITIAVLQGIDSVTSFTFYIPYFTFHLSLFTFYFWLLTSLFSWRMKSEKWKVKNEKWIMKIEKWKVKSGESYRINPLGFFKSKENPNTIWQKFKYF